MTSPAVAERTPLDGLTAASLSEQLLGFVARSHARACAALVLISLACFLPGFASLHPMDRDEPRFAQASKQMLETGDFVDIRFQDEARHKKPAGIYWLQSAAVATAEALGFAEARAAIAVYRIPSLLGAVAAVLLTYWAALAFVARREAFLAAAFMAASMILTVEAHLAKTDAMLAACSAAAMGALARAWLARGGTRLPTATVLAFWVAFAVGFLIKGPLVLMFAGLCAVVLSIRERSARWLLALRPALGLPLTLLVVAPWFAAIAVKSGGAFFQASVGDDMLGKVATGQQQHGGPPGFYLAAFFATFWPAAAFAALAAPYAWRHRREDGFAFALAWAIPSWLIFEAVPTKLPHYVMPLYPALAIATVIAMARGAIGPRHRGAKAVALLIPLVPLGLTLGLAAAAWRFEGRLPLAGLALLGAATCLAVLAWRAFLRSEIAAAALAGVAAAMLVAVGALGQVQPMLSALKISPRLAAAARSAGCEEPKLGTVGYREPSLVFLTRTDLQMFENGREAAAFAAAGGCRLAFVESRHEALFREELARRGVEAALAARVAGFNINGGRPVDLGAYLVKP
jgi:4-amino-4-deoxy-L-arabinose transferase-like glycosyltransferase